VGAEYLATPGQDSAQSISQMNIAGSTYGPVSRNINKYKNRGESAEIYETLEYDSGV